MPASAGRLEARLICQPRRLKYSMFARHFCRSPESACLLQMFFSQITHAEILEPLSDHPTEKRIVGRELVGLFLMTTGFFEFS